MNFSTLGISYAKKSVLIFITLFVGLLVIIGINIVLTPRLHEWGAMIATAAGHIVIIGLCYFLSHKFLPVPFRYIRDSIVVSLYFGFSVLSIYLSLFENHYLDIAVKLVILSGMTLTLLAVLYASRLSGAIRYVAKIFRNKVPPAVSSQS